MSTPADKIAVLGAGSWGTAQPARTARSPDRAVGRDAAVVDAIDQRHENPRYLPGIPLPDGLRATTDLASAVEGAAWILVVTPSHAFGETVRALAPLRPAGAGVAWATKGFEPGSGRFLHEVAREVLGEDVPLAVVTGPSFAKEVTQGLPTAITVHGDVPEFAQTVAEAMHGPAFRAYTGDDMVGAELGGAMKNVLAVATGVADGMQLGLNARAGLITRGLNEMLRLAAAIGAKPETLMGLAGLGDLVLTCTGDLSRNRRLGLALGRGQTLQDAVREIGQVVESVQTADEVMRQARRHGIDLPISDGVRAVLHGEQTPEEGLRALLAREQKPEYPDTLFVNRKPRPGAGVFLVRLIHAWRGSRTDPLLVAANLGWRPVAPGHARRHSSPRPRRRVAVVHVRKDQPRPITLTLQRERELAGIAHVVAVAVRTDDVTRVPFHRIRQGTQPQRTAALSGICSLDRSAPAHGGWLLCSTKPSSAKSAASALASPRATPARSCAATVQRCGQGCVRRGCAGFAFSASWAIAGNASSRAPQKIMASRVRRMRPGPGDDGKASDAS